jgi:Sulfotransferase family
MDDFGDVVYLDVQKTGSTFVSDFLERFLRSSRVNFEKHRPIRRLSRPEVFLFTSVRDPLRQYLSLYQYGCQGRGAIRQRFRKHDLNGFYRGPRASFENWLRFLLDPENAVLLNPRYGRVFPALYGLQTFRFLMLSFENPVQKLAQANSLRRLNKIYDRHKIHSAVVRNESLNQDLIDLCAGPLRQFLIDPDAARDFLGSSPVRTNASARISHALERLHPKTLELVRDREKFLYERFYSEVRATDCSPRDPTP